MSKNINIGIEILNLIEKLQFDLWEEEKEGHINNGFDKSPFVHAKTLKEEVAKIFGL